MPEAGRNIYRIRREQAGFSQEHAAEWLGCSARTLARYESGEVRPPDSVAVRMDDLYNNHFLSYEHLRQTSPIAASLLPEVEDRGFPAAVIRFFNLLAEQGEAARELLRMAEDGKLDTAEREVFDTKILPILNRVSGTVTEVRLAAGQGIGQAKRDVQ